MHDIYFRHSGLAAWSFIFNLAHCCTWWCDNRVWEIRMRNWITVVVGKNLWSILILEDRFDQQFLESARIFPRNPGPSRFVGVWISDGWRWKKYGADSDSIPTISEPTPATSEMTPKSRSDQHYPEPTGVIQNRIWSWGHRKSESSWIGFGVIRSISRSESASTGVGSESVGTESAGCCRKALLHKC